MIEIKKYDEAASGRGAAAAECEDYSSTRSDNHG